MSPVVPSGQLVDTLTRAKLRKDGVRLGLVAAASIVYALVYEQPVLDVVLIGLNGIGALVAAIAVLVAAAAIRSHGRAAVPAVAVYGACLVGHLAALALLLR